MRWIYPDPNDVEENNARSEIIAAMDRWWVAFANHKESLARAFSRTADFDVAGFTNQYLRPVNPHLMWEYGPALSKKGHRLVITPESNHELRPMVRELLKRASSLPHWEFYPGRLPETWEIASGVAEQVSRFKTTGLQARASLGKFRRIDLAFHIDNLKGNEDAAHRYAFSAIEQLLGEDILNRWIGAIELLPAPSLVSRLLKKKSAGLVSPERLKATVDALIRAGLDQLSDPPPRVLALDDPDEKVVWSGFELKPAKRNDYHGRSDLFYQMTCEPEISHAGQVDPIFHSSRFSRTGETFAYLKFDRITDGHGSPPIDTADKRLHVETAVRAVLAEHGLGFAYGGGTGLRYAYVDVALTDVLRAIPILRDLLQNLRLSRRSWLLFFDPEMRDEWIGIHDESPPPPFKPHDDDPE